MDQAGKQLAPASRATQLLLCCGIAAALVYACADVYASATYDGYKWVDYTVSELFAIEAPTRNVVVALFTVHNALLVAFAVGISRVSRGHRALVAIAVLLASAATVGLIADFFAPIHSRGLPQGTTGTWHIILTAFNSVLIMAMMLCGTRTLTRGFRIWSGVAFVMLIAGGAGSSMLATDLATTEPSPWLGVTERGLIYTYLIWTASLAVALLRDQPE